MELGGASGKEAPYFGEDTIIAPPLAVTTFAEQLIRSKSFSVRSEPTEQNCRKLAGSLLHPDVLPPTQRFELYLVRALSRVSLGGKKRLAVIYPPEFLFILDVALASFVGVSVTWTTIGYGDPEFPDFSKAVVRSVPSRQPADLIFPNVTSELVIGIKEGSLAPDVRRELERAGLSDVQLFDFFATARCKPFDEVAVCLRLEKELSFVKYAQPNRVVRLVDFDPGWDVSRLL